MCGQSDKNVQLPVRPRGLIDVRRKYNLLLHPIVICRLTALQRHQNQPRLSAFYSSKEVFIVALTHMKGEIILHRLH